MSCSGVETRAGAVGTGHWSRGGHIWTLGREGWVLSLATEAAGSRHPRGAGCGVIWKWAEAKTGGLLKVVSQASGKDPKTPLGRRGWSAEGQVPKGVRGQGHRPQAPSHSLSNRAGHAVLSPVAASEPPPVVYPRP